MNIFRRISRAVRGSDKDDRENPRWDVEPKQPLAIPRSPSQELPESWYTPPPRIPSPPGQAFSGWGMLTPDGRESSGFKRCIHDHSQLLGNDHYAHCAEIWDKKASRWMIFDQKDVPPERVSTRHDTYTYFCVTARYTDRWSEFGVNSFAEPWADRTFANRSFVVARCHTSGSWGDPSVTAPQRNHEVEMGQALRTLKKTKAKFEEIKEARSKSSTTSLEDKLSLVMSLGHRAVDSHTPEVELDDYLKDIEKQLKVFVAYLDAKFKPIAERLASAIRYKYMEFDLLPYYLEMGQEVWFKPSGHNEPLAMKVSRVNVNDDVISRNFGANLGTNFGTNLGDVRSVTVEGYGHSWNGRFFNIDMRRETYSKFHGRRELWKLPIQLMTPEKREELTGKYNNPPIHGTPVTFKVRVLIEAHLTARGRRYKAEAGICYRIWKGERVVIDRLGYTEAEEYNESDDRSVRGHSNHRKQGRNMAKTRRARSPSDPWGPPVPIPPTESIESLPLEDPFEFNSAEIPDDLLCFMPVELFGYNLMRKEWQSFKLDEVKPVEFDSKAWDHLVLDADVKTLIKGLVQVSTMDTAASAALVNDVIARKGGGLTSVLYGPPGTGKTLTAEAVAELLKRPLLTVGSSDLPRDPPGMEETLRYVLKLATTWDAVMLIDEADVFLEQRSLHEIERNALVSVALRVLEYHRGVVFLTTNRIKVFDEAFLSRFSLAVKYPELNKTGRYVIWSRFLELAGYTIISSPFVTNDDLGDKVIPRQSIEELASKNFNGRTIKNLVRTAQALALSSNSPLKMEHIHIVVHAQEKFLEDFAVERISSD
ncbi:hypothetical protein AAF712_008001 [Marasmius tenuissimus]|uniref:AAA+ ATPase domain-containing protein n=1 Tax=Marasmius tenuissimus TaxID=585030 RepID=A0ABR2ZVB7_9AGAR